MLGFVTAAISYNDGSRLAIIPGGATVKVVADTKGTETFEFTVPGPPRIAEAMKTCPLLTQ